MTLITYLGLMSEEAGDSLRGLKRSRLLIYLISGKILSYDILWFMKNSTKITSFFVLTGNKG